MAKILVIDGERSIRAVLKERLEYEGHRVDVVMEYAAGVFMAEKVSYDAVICDANCRYAEPDSTLYRFQDNIPLIITARDPSIQAAVEAIRSGACDYIPKPIDMNLLLVSLRNALESKQDNHAVEEAKTDTAHKPRKRSGRVENIVGESDQIALVKRLIDMVGPSEARVLILGANGTGKELVARWLHEKSIRNAGPFVEVNCAAIPTELIESELFGHEKGAFTSAIKLRKGKFEQAHGGTLFLDEIGDMSLSAQAKVLRVLQEHRISRVGSDRDIEVDVRVVAATNKNLQDEIERGNFREDLYHRLSVIVINVPCLAERRDDIPLLVDHFIAQICEEQKISRKRFDPDALGELSSMKWRGNIRELRNIVERLVILCGNEINQEDVKRYAYSGYLT